MGVVILRNVQGMPFLFYHMDQSNFEAFEFEAQTLMMATKLCGIKIRL